MSNVAPKWFEKAIANKPEVLSVKIKGTKTWHNFYSWLYGACGVVEFYRSLLC